MSHDYDENSNDDFNADFDIDNFEVEDFAIPISLTQTTATNQAKDTPNGLSEEQVIQELTQSYKTYLEFLARERQALIPKNNVLATDGAKHVGSDETSSDTQDDTTKPLLGSDGIGISIEDAQKLLMKFHNTNIEKDEPMLMLVTLFNAFLFEQEKMEEKYLTALKKAYAQQMTLYLEKVAGATDTIKTSLQDVSLEALIKVNNTQTARMTDFKTHLWIATGVCALSTIINIFLLVK